jgi:tetratricopeptide (TPR) repeat protein
MEFVDGLRIDDYVKSNHLDVPARIKLFRQVCEAVEYAHAQGVVHRDLKPGNILVLPGGRPKLLDFGIAKVVDIQATQSATVSMAGAATPQYASPEQLHGAPTTPASDIYSLGVLLYELLTNRSPYAGRDGNLHTISRAVYEAEPRHPSEIAGHREWKRSLDRVVASALQKDPAARYATVSDLICDLDRFLAGTVVRGRPSDHLAWWKRHAAALAAWSVVFVMAGWWIARSDLLLRPRSAFDRLYAEGIERQQHFDWASARSLFRRAVDADPKNPMGHYAYSAALHRLGYESLAQREAKLANEWSGSLSREKQLVIRGRYQEFTGDARSAVTTYRTLVALRPNNPDYALRLASAQSAAGAPADALQTLASIHGVGDPADQARVALQTAGAYELQSKFQLELQQAQHAAQTADRIGALELKAEALQKEGDALREMNRFDEAVKIYAESEALSREAGDLYAVASIENRLGNMYFNKGDYAALEAQSNTPLALFRQIDNKSAQASILNNLALVRKSRGDTTGALDLFQQAVAISRDAEDLHAESRELTNLGITLRHLGRTTEARKAFEDALNVGKQLGDRDQIARSQITLEQMDRDDGNLSSALDRDRTVLSLLNESKSVVLKSLAWQHLGDDIDASGDTAGAENALEHSLAVARQTNLNQLIADDEFMLADIARERRAFQRGDELLAAAETYYKAQKQGPNLWDAWVTESRLQIARAHAEGTDKKLTEAVRGFHNVKDEARECNALAALIESYLAQKKTADAARTVATSRHTCSSIPQYETRILFRIRALQAEGASGIATQARNSLVALAREVDARGWRELGREARVSVSK